MDYKRYKTYVQYDALTSEQHIEASLDTPFIKLLRPIKK